jgi:hypothetical protein
MPRGSPKSSAGDTETAKATKPQKGNGNGANLGLVRLSDHRRLALVVPPHGYPHLPRLHHCYYWDLAAAPMEVTAGGRRQFA